MTDLERLIDLYNHFGIKLTPEEKDDLIVVEIRHHDWFFRSISDKLHGYSGFFSDLEFTKDGKFIRQGFWEN